MGSPRIGGRVRDTLPPGGDAGEPLDLARVNIQGSTALVTGATSGIGRATAIALARAGARVIVTGRDAEALAAVRDATGGTAVAADLGNSADVERLAAAALSGPAPVEILVNNAGVGWAGSFAAMPR